MKDFKKPPSKEKTIALGFTVAVHVVAITGLLFLGMSKPVEPPKQIKMVLITPEDLPPPEPVPLEQTDSAETAHEKVAEQVQQTAEPSVEPAPIIPVAPPSPITPKPDTNKAVQEAKAEALRQAEQQAAAKADAANKAKADAAEKARADAAEEAKASAAKQAAEEAATKKAEAKKIASTAKRDFENKVKRAWDIPNGSSGQKATARVTLSDSGAVQSVIVNSSDPDMKASVEAAVRAAAPYPMPSDPDVRREARTFTSSFTAK